MVKVSPSILAADFANLERDVDMIRRTGADYVHVDVMDGLFVPNITIGIPVVAALSRVSCLPLDVHLMIDRPVRYVGEFVKAGASIVTAHLEADTPENIRRALETIRSLGGRAGLSLKPGTPAQAAFPFLELCDLVLVMTAAPGFGGQKFRGDMMPKLETISRELARRGLPAEVEVDGGVSLDTCETCVAHGADILVAGSAFFKAKDRTAFTRTLQACGKPQPLSQD